MFDFKNFDIFVDFGNGDKFKVDVSEIDEDKKKIILKGCQGQMIWIKIDNSHPIKVYDRNRKAKI